MRPLLWLSPWMKRRVASSQCSNENHEVPRMRRRALSILLAAALAGPACLTAQRHAQAQNIENGTGVICDSARLVEQTIASGDDVQGAVEKINAQSHARVCEILDIAFMIGGVVAEASNEKGTWQIRKVLVVGIYLGPLMSSVAPYEKYSAFLTSKAFRT